MDCIRWGLILLVITSLSLQGAAVGKSGRRFEVGPVEPLASFKNKPVQANGRLNGLRVPLPKANPIAGTRPKTTVNKPPKSILKKAGAGVVYRESPKTDYPRRDVGMLTPVPEEPKFRQEEQDLTIRFAFLTHVANGEVDLVKKLLATSKFDIATLEAASESALKRLEAGNCANAKAYETTVDMVGDALKECIEDHLEGLVEGEMPEIIVEEEDSLPLARSIPKVSHADGRAIVEEVETEEQLKLEANLLHLICTHQPRKLARRLAEPATEKTLRTALRMAQVVRAQAFDHINEKGIYSQAQFIVDDTLPIDEAGEKIEVDAQGWQGMKQEVDAVLARVRKEKQTVQKPENGQIVNAARLAELEEEEKVCLEQLHFMKQERTKSWNIPSEKIATLKRFKVAERILSLVASAYHEKTLGFTTRF